MDAELLRRLGVPRSWVPGVCGVSAPIVPLAWQAPGTAGEPILICKHIEEPGDFVVALRSINPGQEPFAFVDGREVTSLAVCPDCEIALFSQVTIEWRGAIWPPEPETDQVDRRGECRGFERNTKVPTATAERIEDAQMKPGTHLHGRYRGKSYKAEIVKSGDGVGVRQGRKVHSSLSAAAEAITGHAMNGRVFWKIVAGA